MFVLILRWGSVVLALVVLFENSQAQMLESCCLIYFLLKYTFYKSSLYFLVDSGVIEVRKQTVLWAALKLQLAKHDFKLLFLKCYMFTSIHLPRTLEFFLVPVMLS